MAVATLKLFLGLSLANQYIDLKTAGVLVGKESQNYTYRTETYTFLTATFIVKLKYGKVTSIHIETTKVPPLA